MSLILMAATEQLELTADYPRTSIFHPGLICSFSVAYLVYQLYCLHGCLKSYTLYERNLYAFLRAKCQCWKDLSKFSIRLRLESNYLFFVTTENWLCPKYRTAVPRAPALFILSVWDVFNFYCICALISRKAHIF